MPPSAARGAAKAGAATSPAGRLDAAAIHHRNGDLATAEAIYREILASVPGNVDALHRLGALLLQRGDAAQGATLIEKAVRRKPRDVRMLCNLGTAYRMLGDGEKAAAAFRKACAFGRDDAAARLGLGLSLFGAGKFAPAVDSLTRAAALEPGRADIHVTIARAHAANGEYEAAIAACDTALGIKPDYIDALLFRGRVRLLLGRAATALDDQCAAEIIAPQNPVVQAALGHVFKAVGRLGDAENACREAVRLATESAAGGAVDSLRLAAGAWFDLSQIVRFGAADPDIGEMEGLRTRFTDDDPAAIQLEFAIAKGYLDGGDAGPAFVHYVRGNAMKRATIDFDAGRACAALRAASDGYGDVPLPAPGVGAPPVFVVGMPRSGTTLVEQVLGSHPALQGAGELPYLRLLAARAGENALPPDEGAAHALRAAYLEPAGRHVAPGRRPVDKALNFDLVGLIRHLFPDAPIVHVRRDPVDTCMSCYRQLFASRVDFAYDLRELGLYYGAYVDLMDRWRTLWPDAIFELRYEDLVRDTRNVVRDLLAFCGLPWDEACLAFHTGDGPVLTASAAQVRHRIYDSAIGTGRASAGIDIAPLLDALIESGIAPEN